MLWTGKTFEYQVSILGIIININNMKYLKKLCLCIETDYFVRTNICITETEKWKIIINIKKIDILIALLIIVILQFACVIKLSAAYILYAVINLHPQYICSII